MTYLFVIFVRRRHVLLEERPARGLGLQEALDELQAMSKTKLTTTASLKVIIVLISHNTLRVLQ
jgi:hypothetical protein